MGLRGGWPGSCISGGRCTGSNVGKKGKSMRLSRVDFSPLSHHSLVAPWSGSSFSDWLAHRSTCAPSPLRGVDRSSQACSNLARNDRCSRCRVSPRTLGLRSRQETLCTGCSCSDAELFTWHGASQLTPSSSLRISFDTDSEIGPLMLRRFPQWNIELQHVSADKRRSAIPPTHCQSGKGCSLAIATHTVIRSSPTQSGPVQYSARILWCTRTCCMLVKLAVKHPLPF
jgi:hypothetical protein